MKAVLILAAALAAPAPSSSPLHQVPLYLHAYQCPGFRVVVMTSKPRLSPAAMIDGRPCSWVGVQKLLDTGEQRF